MNSTIPPNKVAAACALANTIGATMHIDLNPRQWVVVTYGTHLRTGEEGCEELLNCRRPAKLLVGTPDAKGPKLTLHMYHGRDNKDVDMDEFGYSARDQEGYQGDPSGDAFVVTDEGVTVVNYNFDGTYTETLIPYESDLLVYEGRYYGDFSIDAPDPDPIYQCIGKSGEYRLIGRAVGAGTSRGTQVMVYQNRETGMLFHRTAEDFQARMAIKE